MQAHNVDCAQLAFAEASGFDVYKTAFANDTLPSVNPVDRNTLNRRMKAFIEATHDVTTTTCASCGERRINDTKSREYRLEELEVLQCHETRQHLYNDNPEFRQHLTIFNHNNQLFDLHTSLLHRNGEGLIVAPMCGDCSDSILKHKRPTFNVGSGHDYGCRVPSLSIAERIVTSRTVLFQTILKLNGTDVKVSRGHVICFEHNGRHSSIQSLPRRNIDELLAVVFIGSKEKWTKLTKLGEMRDRFLKSHPMLTIDPDRVINFLRLKRALDPAYSDIILDDSVTMRVALQELQDNIIEAALIGDDDKSRRAEEANSQPEETQCEESSSLDEDATISISDNIALSHVYVHKPVTTPIARASTVLNIANKVLNNIHTHGQDVIPIRVSDMPVNEFGENETLFLGAFGSLFLLGEGVPTHTGSLSQSLVEHFLHQHDNRFSTTPHFLFTMFNQIQRHAAANNVSFRVKSNNHAMQAFANLMSDPDFPTQLDAAARNPDTPSAKIISRTVLDITRISGATVPWSRMERESALWRIIALSLYAGTYSFFITV